jgi:hypothetical protein
MLFFGQCTGQRPFGSERYGQSILKGTWQSILQGGERNLIATRVDRVVAVWIDEDISSIARQPSIRGADVEVNPTRSLVRERPNQLGTLAR